MKRRKVESFMQVRPIISSSSEENATRYSKLDDTSWSTVNLRTSRTASSLPRRYAFTVTDMLLRDTGHGRRETETRDTGDGDTEHRTPELRGTGTREHGNTGTRDPRPLSRAEARLSPTLRLENKVTQL
ncbi:hypothetical protein EYF80_056468 [Liparis tanakae]|uniref:Uncharacterized protein n=1 Tax=Liparis tanakae TaxID=230148 RepID=A0A4Z2EYS8_9TELE|nr:hypothetical protein EYF80_056468 [Liparis tanakae]